MQDLAPKLNWETNEFFHVDKQSNSIAYMGESLHFHLQRDGKYIALISASLSPTSEILSETILAIIETINAAESVLFQRENFNKFSIYLERLKFVLRELSKLDVNNSGGLKNAIEIINREVKVAKRLALNYGNRNKVYLLLNCQKIAKHFKRALQKKLARRPYLFGLFGWFSGYK